MNLFPPSLPTLGGSADIWGGEVDIEGANADVIVSRKAFVPADARLARCVVWDGARIPPGFHGRDGIFAGGVFRSCRAETTQKVTENGH